MVLAAVRPAPGNGRVRVDIRRAVYRCRPPGAGWACRMARNSFFGVCRALVSGHGSGVAVLDRDRRPHAGPAGARDRLPALPVLRRAADARHGRGQRLLFRSRANVDRARNRGCGNRGERCPGSGPDLRPGRLSRTGNRGRRVGDGDRVVDVGAGWTRAPDAPRDTASNSELSAGGGWSASCSAGS